MGGTASPRAHPGASSPSSTGPAERSARYGSRGPSRTSRPNRAKNNSPHHVTGTGWGERVESCKSLALARCSRAEWTLQVGGAHLTRPSEGEPPDVPRINQCELRESKHCESPENKNRVTVATLPAAETGRDSLEASGTLRTSPQAVKSLFNFRGSQQRRT